MTRRLAALLVLLPFVLAPATRAQGPSDPGPPDASWARLKGRVVHSVTGQPVADLPVLLQCNWLNGQWGGLAGTTDGNGQFSIGTPAGQCSLALNVPPGASLEQRGLPLFEFAPGETVETVRKLDASLTVQPLEGRLLDDRGDPLSGARVILRSRTNRAGTQQWTSRAPVKSDATGSFSLPGVWAGRWEVVVPALGLSRQLEIPRSLAAPLALVVIQGRRVATLAAPLAPVVIQGARIATFRVSGRVETPPGRSRHFALLYLDRADSPPESPLSIAETSSDDSGNFTFAEVPAGAYRIRIDTTLLLPLGGARLPPAEVFSALTPVVVNGDVTGVVVTARAGAELRAEVRLDDQPLSPSQNVLLSVDPADGKILRPMRALDGYLITPLLPGRYRIRTTGVPSGYRIKSVTIGGRDVTDEGFEFSDTPLDNMIVTLTKQITELKGVVRDLQDRPDGEAAVLAFPTNQRLWTNTGNLPAFIGNALVSQKGNYSLTGLPAGEYFVVATLSDLLLTTDAGTLERLAPFAERIRLADGQTLTLNLQTKN